MNNQTKDSHALELSTEELIQAAVNNNEGVIASNGGLLYNYRKKEQAEVLMIDL